jgi:hypothetical protein
MKAMKTLLQSGDTGKIIFFALIFVESLISCWQQRQTKNIRSCS